MFRTLISASIPPQHKPYFLSRKVYCLSFPKHAYHVIPFTYFTLTLPSIFDPLYLVYLPPPPN